MLSFNVNLAVLGVCLGTALAGCGNSTGAYAPKAATARESLDKTLAAWQKGGKVDDLASGTEPIHVVDSNWQNGQALESYEIVGEEPGEGEAEKRFGVKLKMKKGKGEQKVQYILIGQAPVWVFRDEDYVRTSNMADGPRQTGTPQRKSRR